MTSWIGRFIAAGPRKARPGHVDVERAAPHPITELLHTGPRKRRSVESAAEHVDESPAGLTLSIRAAELLLFPLINSIAVVERWQLAVPGGGRP